MLTSRRRTALFVGARMTHARLQLPARPPAKFRTRMFAPLSVVQAISAMTALFVFAFGAAPATHRRMRCRALLLWRHHANRDKRRIGGVGLDPAGDAAFADECRRISSGAAIGAHQQFVAGAGRFAVSGQAILADDAQARTGRSLLALRSRRAGRAGWTGWPDGAGLAGRPLRSDRSGIALRALPAAGKAQQQQPDEELQKTPPAQNAFFSIHVAGTAPPSRIENEVSRHHIVPRVTDNSRTAKDAGQGSLIAAECDINERRKCR